MFEQVFKSLDDIIFQEPGCNSELDYAEQSSWMLFLKYLDDMENERAYDTKACVGRMSPYWPTKSSIVETKINRQVMM